jgi:hypothetical protein
MGPFGGPSGRIPWLISSVAFVRAYLARVAECRRAAKIGLGILAAFGGRGGGPVRRLPHQMRSEKTRLAIYTVLFAKGLEGGVVGNNCPITLRATGRYKIEFARPATRMSPHVSRSAGSCDHHYQRARKASCTDPHWDNRPLLRTALALQSNVSRPAYTFVHICRREGARCHGRHL